MRRRFDIVIGRRVQRVEQRDLRRALREHRLQLSDIEIGGAKVGVEDERHARILARTSKSRGRPPLCQGFRDFLDASLLSATVSCR